METYLTHYEGADPRGTGDGCFSLRDAVFQVDCAVGHPGGSIEGGQQSLYDVLGQGEEGTLARPALGQI